MKIAITGHTARLGQAFSVELQRRGHTVTGFSRSNGYDLRDYSCVGKMLDEIKDYDVFINNAKPDYAQSQILYRLVQQWDTGIIVNIGTDALESTPDWTDIFLLEYLTQKTALAHACRVLSSVSKCNIILLNPAHLDNNCTEYVKKQLDLLNL
jgi:putative NADH-flavin reductase